MRFSMKISGPTVPPDMKFYAFAVRSMRFYLKVVRRLKNLLGLIESRDMSRFIPFYRKIWSEAAAAVGAEFVEIAPDLWEIGVDGRKTIIHNFRTALDNPVVLHLAGNKAVSYSLLSAAGLPVPEHRVISDQRISEALNFMAEHPDWCFIIKPAGGTSGSAGVTTHVRTVRQCLAAVALASLYHDQVLIERQVFGETYRVLVLDGVFLHATKREGLIVAGDGRSTVRQLATQSSHPTAHGTENPAAEETGALTEYACQGLTPDSIPEKGRKILVRSQLSAPGTPRELRTVFTEDVTEQISEAVKEQAIRAAAALDITFAGVDIVTIDPQLPLEESGGAIIEINTTPGLHHHYRDDQILGQPPTVAVLKYLLQNTTFGKHAH